MEPDNEKENYSENNPVRVTKLEDKKDSLENKLKELHNNVRHVTQLAMNWFAFFVTVNYLTMGWLAKGGSDSVDRVIIQIVAGVFIVQNIFGILGLKCALIALKEMKMQVSTLENSSSSENDESQKSKHESIPFTLYWWIGAGLILVLTSLICAWAYIIWHYSPIAANL